jgi:hypothetical protein
MSNTSGSSHERRKSPRQRTLLGATVREMNNTATWSCTVRNICPDGARLSLANTTWLPEQFDLEIASHDKRKPVRVIWRTLDQVGVVFRPEDQRVSQWLGDRFVGLADERGRLRRPFTNLVG